jgi:hypothetical protein
MIPNDKIAFRQALMPFQLKVCVYRKTKREYDEHGRINNTTKKQWVICSIIPGSTMLIHEQGNGAGQRINKTYTFTSVGEQNEVYIGDIIHHPKYSYLKVTQLSDLSDYGVYGATLERINSTELREVIPHEDIVF